MIDEVAELLREVGAEVVLPRHRSLAARDVEEKAPGELVTFVDREAEARLSERLSRLRPAARVVGEEACAADPSLVEGLAEGEVWLVDPLDGTHNFVEGSDDFAVMVALVRDGDAVAAWVHRPTTGTTYVAERGSGAFRDGERLVLPRPVTGRSEALTRFLPPDLKAVVSTWDVGPGHRCAGVDYPLVAEGERDSVLFWRTLPWDHAPGALLVTEAGGAAVHLDGAPYRAGTSKAGLVVARDAATADELRRRVS